MSEFVQYYKLKKDADDFFELAALITQKLHPLLTETDPIFKQIKNDVSFELISGFFDEFTIEGTKRKAVADVATKGESHFFIVLNRLIAQADVEEFASFLNSFSTPHEIIVITTPGKETDSGGSVFISYSSADQEFVYKLSNKLQSDGIRVWLDKIELKAGEPLMERIEAAIEKMDFLIAILSVHSINSNWVKKELEMAGTLELETGYYKILPVIIDSCVPPLSLRGKLYLDFSQSITFEANYEKLLSSVRRKDNPFFLTAREAAALLQNQRRPKGILVTISQKGVNRKYQSFTDRESWLAGDVKTGRSRIWVFEFFDADLSLVRPFSVTDGKVFEHPAVPPIAEEMKSKMLDFVFVDSDIVANIAVNKAIKEKSILEHSLEYVISMDLKYFKTLNMFLWTVVFFDTVLGKPIEVILMNAKNARLVQ